MPIYFAGAFGPVLSALVCIAFYQAGTLIPFLKNAVSINFKRKHFFAAILIPFSAYIFATLATLFISGTAQDLRFNSILNVPAVFLTFLIIAAGEELGWRGFALPLLQQRWSAGRATLIIWMMWGVWHIPAFFIGLSFSNFQDWLLVISGFFLLLLPVSYLFSWMQNISHGKTSLAITMHAAVAATSGITNAAVTDPIMFFTAYTIGYLLILVWIVSFGGWTASKASRHQLVWPPESIDKTTR